MATDIEYDIEVSKNKETVTLKLTVPERKWATDPIIEVREKNAIDILTEKGFNGYNIVSDGGVARVSNWEGARRTAVWVFSNKTTATVGTTNTTTTVGNTVTTTTSTKNPTSTKSNKNTGNKKRRTTVTTKESTTKKS